jgi:hypothetical protein
VTSLSKIERQKALEEYFGELVLAGEEVKKKTEQKVARNSL